MVADRTLIIRPGAIGDFILSLPALEFLRSEYTEVWCAEQNVPLVRFADRVISIGSAGIDRIGVMPADDVFDRLRSFDRIHSWYGSARPDFRSAIVDLPFEFHRALPGEFDGHATEFYCAQVGAVATLPHIAVPQVEPEGFTVIHPFASSAAKRWPLARFRELAGHLGDVRWLAGPEEELERAVRISDLYELACWLKRARLYIGNDSGITHLAAAIELPVVALFGPSDPAIWGPRGADVRSLRAGTTAEIEVTQVLEACLSVGLGATWRS